MRGNITIGRSPAASFKGWGATNELYSCRGFRKLLFILSTVTHKIIMVDIKIFVIRLHTCTYDNW